MLISQQTWQEHTESQHVKMIQSHQQSPFPTHSSNSNHACVGKARPGMPSRFLSQEIFRACLHYIKK